MEDMTIVVLATMIISGVLIILGTIVPSIQEGKAVVAALEAMACETPVIGVRSCGLCEVVDNGESIERARELINEMKKGSLTSFAASKKLMTDSFNTAFEGQMEKERDLLSWCADQPNGREGIAAFLEKRDPVFNK